MKEMTRKAPRTFTVVLAFFEAPPNFPWVQECLSMWGLGGCTKWKGRGLFVTTETKGRSCTGLIPSPRWNPM